jgi:hypothetical protein
MVRDLPFEIDEQLTYDPFLHRFDPSDEPLLSLLLDAYEQVYKATFGSAAASRSEKALILSAGRARLSCASLPVSPLPLVHPQGHRDLRDRVCESAMPIRLLVTESGGQDGLYSLPDNPDQPCCS